MTANVQARRGEQTESSPRSGRTLGEGLGSEDNAINAIRLVLAILVLVSHTGAISGILPRLPIAGLGGWAVDGFFLISGFFIAGSGMRSSWFSFGVRRLARIYPGYWVQLLAVGLVFAPLAVLLGSGRWSISAAADYIATNASTFELVWMTEGAELPHDDAWNGSMWTLSYELTAYLMCGLLVAVPWVRKRFAIVAAVGLVGTTLFLLTAEPFLDVTTNHYLRLARLGSYFCVGMLAYALRDRLRFGPWLVALAGAVVTVLYLTPGGEHVAQVPLMVLLLGLGILLPTRLGSRNDLSYGYYLYAFPIQQIVAISLGDRGNWWAHMLIAAALTAGAAAFSWFLVERPAIRGARRFVAWARGRWWLPIPA
ncbi:acyltransferase family protein [Brachybacterium sp. DNPG3]